MRRLAMATATGGAVLAVAAAACTGDSGNPFDIAISPGPEDTATATPEPTAAPTPTAEPTTEPESGGMDGFRAFAALIDEAVSVGDGSFFAGRATERQQTCAGDEELGPCVDQPAGAVIDGVPQGLWRTDAGGLVAAEEIGAGLESFVSTASMGLSDGFGDSKAALYAIAASTTGVFTGEDAYYAILTAMFDRNGDPERRIIVHQFAFVEDAWKLIGALQAGVLFEEWLTGDCADCYDTWERWEGAP